MKTRKDKTVYVSPVCADIIILKEHGIAEVVPRLFTAGKNFGRDCSPKFKIYAKLNCIEIEKV